MRIGFFTDGYLPSVHGVTVSIETFRKNLEKLGHKVFVFAPAHPHYKDTNPNVFRFKSIRAFAKSDTYFALPFLPEKHQLKEIISLNLDICHAQSPFNMGFLGKYIALHQKKPLVYTHHTLYSAYAQFYIKESLITPYLAKVWSTWFSNLSDLVITPSLKIKKMLKAYGVNKKILILPTGVNLELFEKKLKNRKLLREKLGLPPETKILIFAGRIVEEKNILFLIKSIEEIVKKRKDTILLLVGPGSNRPGSYLNKLKKEVKKREIDKFVKFTGAIPHKNMPLYYQGSDIFVFSSFTETQGLVILEAEACGLPIVALKDDAFADVVKNNENGFLIKEAKPQIFAKKVIGTLDNKKLYQKFSASSLKIAHSFSEEKQAKKLIKAYKSLLQSPLKTSNSGRLKGLPLLLRHKQ